MNNHFLYINRKGFRREVAKTINGNSIKKGRVNNKILGIKKIETWTNTDQQGDLSLPSESVYVFKVMISCSKISKYWSIDGNMDKREIGSVSLETSKYIVVGQILVQIELEVVGGRKGLCRVKITHTVAGIYPANN